MIICGKEFDDGTQMILLGLSEANLQRLRRGRPIRVRRETHGLAIPAGLTIGIVWGEDERAITADLVREGLLDPDAVQRQFPVDLSGDGEDATHKRRGDST